MSSKRKTDPVDGTLIGINEVAIMTGFSPHQLRSWRKPENYDKAVFEALREPNSTTIWYRLADIEDWCAEHGKESFLRAIPAPNAFKSTRVSEPVDQSKRTALEAIAQINSANAYDPWFTKLNKMNYDLAMLENKRQVEWWSKATGKPSEGVERVMPMMAYETPLNSEVFFIGFTLAMRSVLNQIQNLGLTDEEIISVPVGDVPPIRK